jgi:hypothetical protein
MMVSEFYDRSKRVLLICVASLKRCAKGSAARLDGDDRKALEEAADALGDVDDLVEIFAQYERILRWVADIFVIADSNGTMDIDLDKLRQHPMKVTDLGRFIPGGNMSLATVLAAASEIGRYDPKHPILRAEMKKLRAFGTEAARAKQQENADKRNAPLVRMSERDDDIGSIAKELGISKDAARKRIERRRRKGKISARPPSRTL